jgi:hypothetical protein
MKKIKTETDVTEIATIEIEIEIVGTGIEEIGIVIRIDIEVIVIDVIGIVIDHVTDEVAHLNQMALLHLLIIKIIIIKLKIGMIEIRTERDTVRDQGPVLEIEKETPVVMEMVIINHRAKY